MSKLLENVIVELDRGLAIPEITREQTALVMFHALEPLVDAAEAWALLERLVDEEGDSVVIPHYGKSVRCYGEWTGNRDEVFCAGDRVAALRSAVLAKDQKQGM